MAVATVTSVNVKQAVPFFGVTNMESSLRYYVDGLGFKMKNYWIPDRAEDHPDGRIRWCWLQLGDAAIMPQEFRPQNRPKETLGTAAATSSGRHEAPRKSSYQNFLHRTHIRRTGQSIAAQIDAGIVHQDIEPSAF